ncbi:MAG TPA: GNAT family N-acetyltransferase [Dehalococcoidia bacterium]|jgi:RimJ/RimL family protein N-acetyltransferase|nr:GNAT family N-acetyltransferase [Dehalococcoidia bacterium]
MRTSSMLLIRVKYILRTEGLISLVNRAASSLIRRIFHYGTFYLYEHTTGNHYEADFMPRMQDFTFKLVATNQQASELAANSFEDFRGRFLNSRRGLDKGAIAFCIFHGLELAHIGWVAMTEEAKNTFDTLPYYVNFLDNQACTGGTITVPKYRGKGLMTYGYFKRFEYLRKHGITTSRNAVNAGNVASQKVHAKFGPIIYARARYIKILWWKFWKEVPIEHTTVTNLPNLPPVATE